MHLTRSSNRPGLSNKRKAPCHQVITDTNTTDEINVRSECTIPCGAVGYRFRKTFPGYGVFEGRVIQVRPGAALGRDRRCVYTDGDVEDLSLEELQKLDPILGGNESSEKESGCFSESSLAKSGAQEIPCKRPKAAGQEMYALRTISNPTLPIPTVECDESTESVSRKRKSRRRATRSSRGDTLQRETGGNGLDAIGRLESRELDPIVTSDSASTGNKSSFGATRSSCSKTASISSSADSSGRKSRASRRSIAKEITSNTYIHCPSSPEDEVLDNNHSAATAHAQPLSLFAPLGDEVPLDPVAEATITDEITKSNPAAKGPRSNSGEESSTVEEESDTRMTDIWLEQVATRLARNTAKSNGKKRKIDSTEVDNAPLESRGASPKTVPEKNVSSDSSSKVVSSSKTTKESNRSEMVHLVPLLNVDSGKRYGLKVFNKKDEKRLVAEVLLDDHGWIEAASNGEMMRDRVSSFVVAPDSYRIGESVDTSIPLPGKNNIKDPSTLKRAKLKKLPVSPHGDDAGQLAKSDTGQVINGFGRPHASQKAFIEQKIRELTHQNESPPSRVCQPIQEKRTCRVTLESLFYWCCDRCTMMNGYKSVKCRACTKKKNSSCNTSALLEIASAAAGSTSTVDEAESYVPPVHKPAIPREVLSNLISLQMRTSAPPQTSDNKPISNLDDFFYWICSHCTVVNSYKRSKCKMCLKQKTSSTTASALLDIAVKAAKWARTVQEATNLVPVHHRWAIPEVILESMITCAAMVGDKEKQRRCLNPKAPGTDFCRYHCDPLSLTPRAVCYDHDSNTRTDHSGEVEIWADSNSPNSPLFPDSVSVTSSEHEVDSSERGQKVSSAELKNALDSVTGNTLRFLTDYNGLTRLNRNEWMINSIEDGVICEATNPYPLGMKVRRFFPRYGFHDGRIVKVRRRMLVDELKGSKRAVLIYRTLYEDGDEEDFMHHEITSLRQAYDLRNIPSTASPASQLTPGSVYECHRGGMAHIVQNFTPSGTSNPAEGGMLRAKFCRNGCPWTEVDLALTEFQLNVVRKSGVATVAPEEPEEESLVDEVEAPMEYSSKKPQDILDYAEIMEQNRISRISKQFQSPLLEWPGPSPTSSEVVVPSGSDEGEKKEWMLEKGLWIFVDKFDNDDAESDNLLSQELLQAAAACRNECDPSAVTLNDPSSVRQGISRSEKRWDPANISDHLLWDPFAHLTCEVCKLNKDDHQILICDGCHLGYHMYCVRPVLVNVPTDEWRCPRCVRASRGGGTFEGFTRELLADTEVVAKFLRHPHSNPGEFYEKHKALIELLKPSNNASFRRITKATARSKPTAQIGELYVSHNVSKNDWVLPQPPPSREMYVESITSMVAAMQYCGMTEYSEELVYGQGSTKDMNDAKLEHVEPMSQRNMDVFTEFKKNLRNGLFPPVKVVYERTVGFTVEALVPIARHTLIAEYVGEVTSLEKSGETSSDSLMLLLTTDDPKTSLIIDPTNTGNIARFLSGVNNGCHHSRRKANVRTRRFSYDGKCRVALFTSKKIDAGDKLYYDYNAGVEGKDVVEWAKNGFYDTSNFY